jgi:glutamyl-tRNA reductase
MTPSVTDPALPDRSAGLERIEVRYATFRDSPGHERTGLSTRLRDLPADERVLLDTCHRVELVSVDAEATDAEPQLRGAAAVRRVFEVVAGFDSAVVAEEQLLGQVRGAYEAALAAGDSGPILNELFRRALRFGRHVRSHAQPGTDRSLADPGVAWIRERLAPGDPITVAGTGEMGRLVAQRLAAAGHPITVLSASAERGGRLLEALAGGGHHLAVGALSAELVTRSHALAIAVRSRTPLLTAAHLGGGALPWILDLSAPPAVAEDAATALDDRLMDLDRLGKFHGGAPVLAPEAEARLRQRLTEEVDRFVTWLEARRSANALELLHREADAVRRRHLDRLRRRAELSDEQLAAVEAASAAMLGELLHGPTVEIRRGGTDAATVRRLFGIEA